MMSTSSKSISAKQESCLRHWLSVFTLAVPLFRLTVKQNRKYDYILKIINFYILDIYDKM